MSLPAAYPSVTITAIHPETPGVKTFTIAGNNGYPLQYKAGQFITIVFRHHDREERRSFSLSSCPALGELPAFTVKRIDNGAYSRLLTDKAQPGDILYTAGCGGMFTLPPDVTPIARQVFFFAAGIGITPVFSMLKELLHSTRHVQAVLIYSNHTPGEVVFMDQLDQLLRTFPERLQIEYLYSTSFNLERARLSKQLVPLVLQQYARTQKSNMLCYMCGPYSYMRMVSWALEESGIPGNRIRKENFNPNEQVAIKAEPPDKQARLATVNMNGTSHTFICAYPDTLLLAARKNGIALPYSCETGRCGSCAALCTSGKVWQSYNEVLTDSDVAAGRILTCTGHPVGGDVTISI